MSKSSKVIIFILMGVLFLSVSSVYAETAKEYVDRGIAYYKQKNFTQAISEYNKAIAINPNYADAYYNRGVSYYETKEYGKAWADVHQAENIGFKADPYFIEVLEFDSGQKNYPDISAKKVNQMYVVEGEAEKLQRAYGNSVAVVKVLPFDALVKGDVERVARDIADGADVNKVDGSGTPLCLAVEFAHKEMVKLLLMHGANPSLKDSSSNGVTPLHEAFFNFDKPVEEEIAELLIANGADVNARDSLGNTPLIALINYGKGNKKIAELLIEKGADVNSISNGGNAPLRCAVANQDKEMIELLIKKGANVNQRNSYGGTVLMQASILLPPKVEIVELLLSAGADINARDNQGKTVLVFLEELKAAFPKYPEDIISLLKAHGAVN